MAHGLYLSRRIARLQAPLFAALILVFSGCDSTESVDPESSIPETAVETADQMALADPAVASASYAGIPFGMSAQPLEEFRDRFNGAKLTIGTGRLMSELQTIRSHGGRVIIMLAGNPRHYRDGSGHFSLEKWKQRVGLFKNINFSSYINDGTIVGHFLLDEPNDPRNWSGRPVSSSVVEEMATYSKQLWPGMATIIRAHPDYLGFNHKNLDAAWAAYLWRRGNVDAYLKKSVADAQARGLALVVGMNVIKGGSPNGTKMSASEVENWGSAMMNSSYPCAFLMYEHNSSFLKSAGMSGAMDALRRKAAGRPAKSCRS